MDTETVLPASHDARPELNVLKPLPAWAGYGCDWMCMATQKQTQFVVPSTSRRDAPLKDQLSTLPALLVVVASLEALVHSWDRC